METLPACNAIKLKILYSEMETLVPSNRDLAEARFPQKLLNLMAVTTPQLRM